MSLLNNLLSRIVKAISRKRRQLAGQVFSSFVVPKETAISLSKSSFPGSMSLAHLNLGDVIIMVPLLALLVAGIRFTLDQSPALTGQAAWYAVVATLLLANKSTSALSLLLGKSWERVVPYHHGAAYIAIVNSILHGCTAYLYDGSNAVDFAQATDDVPFNSTHGLSEYDVLSEYSQNGEQSDVLSYLFDMEQNLSGTIMTFCIVFLVLTSSIRWFRKTSYHVWFGLHIFFFICLAASSLLHAMSKTKLILIWWLIDVSVRHMIHPTCCSPDSAKLTRILPDVLEIRFRRCFRYRPGQFIRIAIGSREFHPASISSAPHEEDVTVHFRVCGDWTQRLVQLAEKSVQAEVSVQGPFGNISMDVLDDNIRYPHVILLCGGIGVTPMLSLARHLVHTHLRGKRRGRIHLVWVVANAAIVDALPILQRQDQDVRPNDGYKHISPEFMPDEEEGEEDSVPCSQSKHLSVEFGVDGDYSSSLDETEEMTDSSNASSPKPDLAGVFHSDIYMTKSTVWPRRRDPNTTYHHGRPDLRAILSSGGRSQRRIAVLACGPKSLVQSAKVICRETSTAEGCILDFHEEIFDY